MTLGGNITINTPYTSTGYSMTLILTQDGIGSRTLTSGAALKWANGSKTLSTIASSTDIVSFFYDGTTYWSSLGRGFV